jgi:virulence-associated protein VagC
VRSTVFRSGNNQAVRIPVALRLDCNEVTIRRDGASLVIEPIGAIGWPAG